MKRREFIGAAASLTAAGAIWPHLARGATAASIADESGPYLDAHVHPLSPALIAYRQRTSPPRAQTAVDGAELVRRMDRDGVRRAFALSTAYQMAADVWRQGAGDAEEQARVRGENDYAAEQCALFPDRLVPFLSVNPRRAYALDEIDRCVDARGMRGLKLHFWNSLVDTRQPEQLAQLRRVVSHAAARGLPVVAHVFIGAVADYGPADTERFVREVVEPVESLRISFAHLAGAGGFATPAQQCFERLVTLCGPESAMAGRVWVDMSATLLRATTEPERATCGELLRRWGLHRVLYGSDNIVDALAQTREAWPLSKAEWERMRTNRGEELLSSGNARTK